MILTQDEDDVSSPGVLKNPRLRCLQVLLRVPESIKHFFTVTLSLSLMCPYVPLIFYHALFLLGNHEFHPALEGLENPAVPI